MPFVRLYIYHENDLFSLIPLFCVTNKIVPVLFVCHCPLPASLFRCGVCVCVSVQLDAVCGSSGIARIRWTFFCALLSHSLFLPSRFFLYKTINISLPLVLFCARSLTALLQFTLVRFVYTRQ